MPKAAAALDAVILDPRTGEQHSLAAVLHPALAPAHDWEIRRDADGTVHAIGAVCASVAPGGAIVKRTAIKNACTPQARGVRWLRIELDGVKVYFDGAGHIVVSKEDLWP